MFMQIKYTPTIYPGTYWCMIHYSISITLAPNKQQIQAARLQVYKILLSLAEKYKLLVIMKKKVMKYH